MGRRLILILALLPVLAWAGRIHTENVYNRHWCAAQGGAAEVTLRDRTRVDCILPNGYVVEADFANKYSEGVGQALHYAAVTDMAPGLLVIVEYPERDQKYLDRLYVTLTRTCPAIRLWVITPEDL